MIATMLTSAARPAKGPTSSRTIWPRDLPPRRTEQNMITQSCTAPPSVAPMSIHSSPGMKPNCAASTGPTSGPGPAIAAKWWPKTIHLLVWTKSLPSSFTTAGGARSSVEQTDWHDEAERAFLRSLAGRLDAAVSAGETTALTMVASPRALGMIRADYSDVIRRALRGEVGKDLVKLPVYEIEKQLLLSGAAK